MPGKFYDQWQVGEVIEHPLRRTVTETDNLLFTTMTHNPQPLHLDAEAAKGSEFGQILVNGTFTFALMVGLTVAETTMGTLIANLGYDKLVMPKPVFIGEVQADGQFQVVWKSKGLIRAEPWSPYIPAPSGAKQKG